MFTAQYDRFDDVTRVVTRTISIESSDADSTIFSAELVFEQDGDRSPPFKLSQVDQSQLQRLYLDIITTGPPKRSTLTVLIDGRLRARPDLRSEWTESATCAQLRLRYALPREVLRLIADATTVELRLDLVEGVLPRSSLRIVSAFVAFLDGQEATMKVSRRKRWVEHASLSNLMPWSEASICSCLGTDCRS